MRRGWRAIGTGLVGSALLLSGLVITSPASAGEPPTSDVSEATWQEVWADVGHPNTAEKWS
ncbi:MAG: hypothetical protein VW239_08775, partial [Candidatus Nanopelagicales bacterium]